MCDAVWWVKRDARLADNPALTAAIAGHRHVFPLFAVEPAVWRAADASPLQAHAQFQAVAGLRAQLVRRGADVAVLSADAVDALAALHRRFPFGAVYAHEETGTEVTFARDRAVAAWCRAHRVRYHELPQSSVVRAGVNRDRLQEVWMNRVARPQPFPPVARIPQSTEFIEFAGRTVLPKVNASVHWQPITEVHAGKTLSTFLNDRGFGYSGGISSPNAAFTHGSRLSAHLAWGTISVRQVYHATVGRLRALEQGRAWDDPSLGQWRRGLRGFLARLHWRDHFAQRLETEPDLEFRSIHPAYRDVAYEDDPRLLDAWAHGRTGFPLVDAVMRCLAATGFANFRMRALVTSVACHALHLDWRTIHPPLARVFRDYDPGIHLSQLQMQAGVVGFNTVRVYNPHKQLLDQDPKCVFVKRWVPELRDVPAERILHHPDEPVPGYPPPVVDWLSRSRAMKDALFAVRNDPAVYAVTRQVYHKHASRRTPLPRPPAARRPARRDRPDQPTLF